MSDVQTTAERSRGGRPLDASRDDAILQATLELLAEIGYDRLTIDAVAARARAGKATVYRRWPGKAELVAEAFACDAFKGLDAPDTGSLRSDLIAMAEHMWLRRGPVPRALVMAGMMSALLANPELRQAFQGAARPPQSVVSHIIQRGVERGDIPEPDHLETLSMVMPGMCMFNFVKTGEIPDTHFIELVVDRIMLPSLDYQPPTSEGKRS